MLFLEEKFKDYLTPYKYGKPVLAPSGVEGEFDRFGVDNLRIVSHGGKFYMFYIGFDGTGYRTALAVSDDLLHWEKKGIVLDKGSKNPWDTNGRAVSSLFCNPDLYGKQELIKYDGKYIMFYHAYPGKGYETGAAANGLAWSTDENLLEWHCEDAPVFEKGKSGEWDGDGLYSARIIQHDGKFCLYYTGKKDTADLWNEQIGFAFSDNLHDWKRYEKNPILKVSPGCWDSVFTSGGQLLFDSRKKRWVMFYFGFNLKRAQEGIAVSDDMLNFEKCPEPIITCGKDGEIDSQYAHKPCVIYHDGMLWHFYCAVRPTVTDDEKRRFGNEYRCITVARSKKFE